MFCRFAQAQLASGDIDPTYPVLKRVHEGDKLDMDTALWRTLLYVTWYRLDSSEEVWKAVPALAPGLKAKHGGWRLPTGTERRGFRGNDLAWLHLDAVEEAARPHGGLAGWVEQSIGQGGKLGWEGARQAFQALPHGGNWSSYKWADLLKHVHGYPITANDIGVGGGSATAGPVPGMVRLTGEDWRRCATDLGLQQELHDECVRRGVPFNGLDQLETALCDYNSLCKGSYYVGNDIDLQMDYLKAMGAPWWEARAASFPAPYLGEVSGWFGARKELRTAYRDRGELVCC